MNVFKRSIFLFLFLGISSQLLAQGSDMVVLKKGPERTLKTYLSGSPIHFITIAIGHFNHANIKITWGPLRYIFNNPVMHLYHHASVLPKGKHGVNYGISLSLWDYIFKTNYIPEDSGKVEIGFKGDDKFPKDFIHQNLYGFKKGQR